MQAMTAPAAVPAAVRASHLSKAFQGRSVVTDLSFQVQPHQFVSIVGPSGCGKSTVLRLVSGLLPATSGGITVAGREVRGPQPDVGIVFQAPVLLPWRSVLGNILFCIEMRGGRSDRHRDRALALIKLAGLEGFENHLPHQLSGGMQQRVSICRALMTKPALLLMDEPFGALDIMTREKMGFELQRLWEVERYSALFVTHSIAEAVLLSDAVIAMPGRGSGRPARIFEIDLRRPRTPETMKDPRFLVLSAALREELEAGWIE